MDSHPKTSVIICLHNYAQYVGNAISSVLDQGEKDFELIVIDDGSTDDSYEIAASFNDYRIRLFQQENAGLGITRNLGISLARGRYFAFLDADDVWTTEKLGAQCMLMDSDLELVMVYSRCGSLSPEGSRLSNGYAILSAKPEGYIQQELVTGNCIGTPSIVLFRRQPVVDNGLAFNECLEFVEDWHFYVQVAAVGKVAYIAKTLAYHRLHASNMQSSHNLLYQQGLRTIQYAADIFRSSDKPGVELLNRLIDRGRANIASVAARECLKSGDMVAAREFLKQALPGGVHNLRDYLLYLLALLNLRPGWVINWLK